MRPVIIAMSLLSAFSVGVALAQTPPAADAMARAKEAFDKADQDKDGALNLKEWKAMGRRERGFQMMDADHDGKLTPDEIRSAIAAYRKQQG
ncbi:hypothetical protein ACFOKF_20945 [Sphingobium rhizovicinum]|uniref:EF-hand domain-containing protein n=1 Tax=Sphingobium rhizovicinum TaxID=432308 RepID=A0ABV7NJE7_9SPHN